MCVVLCCVWMGSSDSIIHSHCLCLPTHQAKKKAAGGSDDYSSDDDSGLPPLEANPNRANADVEAARTMEAAIDLLGGSECLVWS